jgi:hypothetical protein
MRIILGLMKGARLLSASWLRACVRADAIVDEDAHTIEAVLISRDGDYVKVPNPEVRGHGFSLLV